MKLLLEIGILIASSREDDVAMVALPLAFHAVCSSILRSEATRWLIGELRVGVSALLET